MLSSTDASLDLVQGADHVECLRGGLRFGALRLEELPPGVRPALSVGDPGLGRVVGIGAVAVGEQHRALGWLEPQGLFDMLGPAAVEEREAHLVELAVHRPEVRPLHLARPHPPRLDRGLVHGLDAAVADRGELRRIDRLEQACPLVRDLGQPRPADRDASVAQALVLPVQRDVVGELVDQRRGHEAHLRPAGFDHAHRSGRAHDGLACAQLDHRPAVLEHHVAARRCARR